MDRRMNSTSQGVYNNAGFPEIKSDLSALKDDATTALRDAAVLARDLKDSSGSIARQGVNQLKSVGQNEFHRMEERVRAKPGQSVALAFCAGLIFSYVLGHRR